MTDFEYRMCELQADIFEKSLEKFDCSSPFFIAKYMNSKKAEDLDDTNDNYNYCSVNSALRTLEEAYPSLKEDGNIKYPASVIRWIGYIYRAWSIITHKSSSKLYKQMKAERLLGLYDVFHTFGIDYCVDRLEELVNDAMPKKDYYEIFKEVMLQN